MAIAAGTRLGPYVVAAPLGAGGMGEVYRARDPRLDRDVAIKVAGALADLRRAKDGRFLWYAFYARCDPRMDAVRGDAGFPGSID